MGKNGVQLLAVASGLVFLAVVMRTDSSIGMAIKFFLGKLVYSTSDGAILFTIGFAALSLLGIPLVLPSRTLQVAGILLWGGLLVGYGAHLAVTLRYFSENQIPLSAHVYRWSDGVNSYTSLLHSHLGKAAMSSGAQWLFWSNRYDTGQALVDDVPASVAWLIGCAFAAAMVGALLKMPTFHERYGHRKGLTIAYLIALVTVLKSIFDGGALAYAVPPSLLLIVSFWFNSNETQWIDFWRRYGFTAALILIAGYASLWIGLTPGRELPLFGPWLFYLAVLALLSTGKWSGLVAKASRMVLIGYLAINCLFDFNDNLAPLLQPLASSAQITHLGADGQISAHSAQQYGDTPVFRIYRDLGDDPWKPRNTLIQTEFTHGLSYLDTSLRVLFWHGQQGSLFPTPALRIEKIGIAENDWISIRFSINQGRRLPPILICGSGSMFSRNNYYVWLYQVDLLLRNAGWRGYVLMPHVATDMCPSAPALLEDEISGEARGGCFYTVGCRLVV